MTVHGERPAAARKPQRENGADLVSGRRRAGTTLHGPLGQRQRGAAVTINDQQMLANFNERGLWYVRGLKGRRRGFAAQRRACNGNGAAPVTTVDVYISRTDGSDSFSLHNGLFGAAITALHALISRFHDGTISGPWHSSYIDTTVKGTIIRSILAGIGELGPPYHQPGDWARFAAFQEAIDDDADYSVRAIEV
jgi:hypothetical protein